MKKLFPLLSALLIAAVCGTGGYFVYEHHQRTREQKAGSDAELPHADSVRREGPVHTMARTRFRIFQSSAPDLFGTVPAENQAPKWLETQVKAISSDRVLAPVVKRLNLEAEWGLSAEQAVARLQEMVEVEWTEGTDVVAVTVRGYAANTCADVANAVRDAYEQVRKDAEAERWRRLTQTVDAQIEAQQKVVEARKAEVEALKKKHGIADTAPPNHPPAKNPPAEYVTERPRDESQVMLLNTIRELRARQGKDGPASRPVETLEVARPGLPHGEARRN